MNATSVLHDAAAALRHGHVFDTDNHAAERGARAVLWMTLLMMALEIGAGWRFNSMALLADGWHMSSHAIAIGLSAAAYAAVRRHARDARFAFGAWKIEVLAGFASAVVLAGIAALMVYGAVERLVAPQPIHYREAIAIAALGLAVNLVCALILHGAHGHHSHDDHHHHDHHGRDGHEDLNLKAAYVHVLADAATSMAAIAALAGGWIFGWSWLDPVIGIAGALVVAAWAKNLIVQTGKVLLDREMDHPVVDEIRAAVEDGGNERVVDLHVWRVGKRVYACAVSLVTSDAALTAQAIKERIGVHEEVVHTTIEIHYAH
jgi:cation diffusion facilitator family transporter